MQDRVMSHEKIEIIWNAQIMEVLGEDKVSGIRYKDIISGKETDVPLEGVFLAIGHKPDTEIFKDHVAVDSKGYILNSQYYALKMLGKNPDTSLASQFDPFYTTMTTVPGVFAAGDCVDYTYRQASTAAGMGVAASLDAERWLELKKA
jgi:thioredoxin reductase (NADPH)